MKRKVETGSCKSITSGYLLISSLTLLLVFFLLSYSDSTGEKTNPGPLQGILATDPMISAALYFGRQKHQAGVLIEPSKGTKIECVSEFREAIWATVEKG